MFVAHSLFGANLAAPSTRLGVAQSLLIVPAARSLLTCSNYASLCDLGPDPFLILMLSLADTRNALNTHRQ